MAARDAGAVWFRATHELEPSGDAEIALNLIPAMRVGGEVSVESASPRLLANVSEIQKIFRCWDPTLNEVRVTAGATTRDERVGDRVAAFFSGGVDSFYTTLRNREEITDLIFLHGFDFSLDQSQVRRRASRAAREVAAALRKNLIEVETDYRDHVGSFLHWRLLHGAALAVVALLLQRSVRRLLIASTHSYRRLIPFGSHPLLDPLWSTEGIEIVHDGADSVRPQKVAYLAESSVAMRHLRVCWQNTDGEYNCGRCAKCLRTMVNLRVAGALRRCETLPNELDTGRIARLKIKDENDRFFWLENLRELEQTGRDPELERALRRGLALQPLWAGMDSLRNRAGRIRRRLVR